LACIDPAKCKGIASGASRRIAFTEVAGYQWASGEAVVFHWRLIRGPSSSGFVADSIRSTIVQMRILK
jgi:hypothetical protein